VLNTSKRKIIENISEGEFFPDKHASRLLPVSVIAMSTKTFVFELHFNQENLPKMRLQIAVRAILIF